eukprot:TRINITY_DN545_c0_g2_i1.p1 TRINITY_DN545_c0_g2~~TRINITY_DN545_c0_g2_i1.p1  ORF type:complete len:1285 (-),score=319.74 TRINITY_DN545_c0_g2_i1:1312-4797(-)
MEDMLTRGAPTNILTLKKHVHLIPAQFLPITLCVDSDWDGKIKEAAEATKKKAITLPEVGLDDLAYCAFSSGTTGKSKAIYCPHRGAVNSYFHRRTHFPFIENDRVAVNIFLTWECIRPLLGGAETVIIPDSVIHDPPQLLAFFAKERITRILVTPSLLQAVLDIEDPEIESKMKTLRLMWLCGEVVSTELQRQFIERVPHCALWNLYSVSECHDVAMIDLSSNITDGEYAIAGQIMDNTEVFVMDEMQNVLPMGAVGELYVGGTTLARGYGNPELTKSRFLPHPQLGDEEFEQWPDMRIYKTGDIARLLPGGKVEIRGRMNSMVKLRGYSIELGAVEAALSEHPKIASARAFVSDDEDLNKRKLHAYIVFNGTSREVTNSGAEIKNFLKDRLMHYMIPNTLVRMEALPIDSASGKLDARSLPRPEDVSDRILRDHPYREPKNEMELQLGSTFRVILELPPSYMVGLDDDFLSIGGNSFSIARLYASLEEMGYGDIVDIDTIYEHPTVAKLSEYILARKDKVIKDSSVDFSTEAESLYPLDLQPLADSPLPTSFSTILLTGATGYLGGYLLSSLLEKYPSATIICPVRAESIPTAARRIRDNLSSQLLWQEVYTSRVVPVIADLEKPMIGMTKEKWDSLSTEVDAIYHCGAAVNFTRSYKALKAANVDSTLSLLKFAVTGKNKAFLFISTIGVFWPSNPASNTVEVGSELPSPDGLHNSMGYEQSKFVAEQIVRFARTKGLPVVVARPGNLTGHTRTGKYNAKHDLVRLLKAFIKMKSFPDWNRTIDLTPVNLAAEAIVGLPLDSSDSKWIHNVIHPGDISMKALVSILRGPLCGFRLQRKGYHEWLVDLNSEDASNPAAALYPTLRTDSYRDYPHAKIQDSVWSLSDVPEPTDIALRLLVQLVRDGSIPAPPMNTLFGKAYVLTGASSGIGSAIAEMLAQRGALVAIGARRLDRLEALKDSLVGTLSEQLMCQKTDVTVRSDVESLVESAKAQWEGYIDGIILNAGVMPCDLMENCNVDSWIHTIDVNVKGVLHGIGASLKGMLARGRGDIVVMSSDAGRHVYDALAVYSGSKFALEAICQGLRAETYGKGIRVCSVQPGDVATELLNHTTDKVALERVAGGMAKKILDPADVARAVVYALSEPAHVGINEVMIEPSGVC